MPTGPSGPLATILLVENEPTVAGFLVELLTFAGYGVETAPDGRAALARLAEMRPDVVLSDLDMPNLDGPGLYAEIVRRHPELRHRFLLLAGDVESERVREFLERSLVPYLAKPFRIEEVLNALHRLIG